MSITDALQIIIGGDFNVDLKRDNNRCSDLMNKFIYDECLACCTNNVDYKVTFTYESKCSGIKSCIDHFLVSPNLCSDIKDVVVLSDGNNLSDHLPLCLSLHMPVTYSVSSVNNSEKTKMAYSIW